MLHIEKLKKQFGGIHALNGCSLRVEQHSLTGIIGPNGSGKTTLFNVITGFYRADEGQIQLHGQDIHRLQPNAIVQQGLVRTFQLSRVFAGMSVLENMLLAAPDQHGERLWHALFHPGRMRRQEQQLSQKAADLLDFVNLYDKREDPAGSLSYGQQKLLELARALMTEPSLLLLDEPTAGVNPILTERLASAIVDLRKQGITFFIIEHNMDFIKTLCDQVIVLDYGEKIAEGNFETVRSNERVIEAYLGKATDYGITSNQHSCRV